MKEQYEKLYVDTNVFYRYNRKRIGLNKLSHFTAMKGCRFDLDDVRLFVIGRAVNGWETLPCESSQIFADAAEKEFHAAGFTWIADNGSSFYSLHNISEGGEPVYYLSRSPFWRTIEAVWRNLSGLEDFRFIDHIAWSNLYKIAPKESGNPTITMRKRQFAACKDILETEIRAYNPTHILFITGYDRWYAHPVCDFSALFLNNRQIGSNIHNKTVFAEGTAEYILNGKTVPVVIACRPEMRDEAAFVSDVSAAFRR